MSDQISLPESVRFQDTELSIIDHNGTPWLTSADLARALKFAKTDAVTRLYNRSKDEFDASMTETVTVTASGNLQKKVRIFSPRECRPIAMLEYALKQLRAPFPSQLLAAWPVSTDVNKVANTGRKLMEPIGERCFRAGYRFIFSDQHR